jgi:hypothetical protein
MEMTPPSKRASVVVQVVPASSVEKAELLGAYIGVAA